MGLTGADLSVRAIEVTQAIQNLANDVPLVENKLTWARVFVRAVPGSQPARVHLHGYCGGVASCPAPPFCRPGASNFPNATGGRRGVLHDSYNFLIPQAWRQGTVTLLADAEPWDASLVDPDAGQQQQERDGDL